MPMIQLHINELSFINELKDPDHLLFITTDANNLNNFLNFNG